MPHSYKDKTLYVQDAKGLIQDKLDQFNEYLDKPVEPDLNTFAINTVLDKAFWEGTKMSVIADVLYKQLIKENM